MRFMKKKILSFKRYPKASLPTSFNQTDSKHSWMGVVFSLADTIFFNFGYDNLG